ncbi:hypothetical protein [Marimonas arenosa]|uniref:Bro-N domain-containing protein n=1 Tax=Marimonas arenosa TaxID=1795305 RepID=A0AAE3WE74_9RHOB|nr:hypothetical protein [Marimonas arenosa]MDQ2091059.1 hypothetical protein [Marimonas arenosa]
MTPTDTTAGAPSAAPHLLLDHHGYPLFGDVFHHRTETFGGAAIDIIETNGNIWFSGSDALNSMGFEPHRSGGQGRRLKRIEHPDIIKIADTPFRFADGRRNRGSFISPRAILKFADSKTQGFNPFKALPFAEWMKDIAISGGKDAEACSPARPPPTTQAPIFHAIEKVADKDEHGHDLDQQRPVGIYQHVADSRPILHDEIEFCLCSDERVGLGKCWCRGKGGIRSCLPPLRVVYEGDDVIDDGDDGTESGWVEIPTRKYPPMPLRY